MNEKVEYSQTFTQKSGNNQKIIKHSPNGINQYI